MAYKPIETVKKNCVLVPNKEIPIGTNYRVGFFNILDNILKKREL